MTVLVFASKKPAWTYACLLFVSFHHERMRGRGIKGVTYTNDQIRAEAMDSEAIKRLLFAEKN
jgi:hypothetical protein